MNEKEKSELISVCKKLVGYMAKVDDSRFEIMEYTGGTSNRLFLVRLGGGDDDGVLVRRYSERLGAASMVDRAHEAFVFGLVHAAGLGPAYFGDFPGGCVYGHVRGRGLTLPEFRSAGLARRVARTLARWHREVACTDFRDGVPEFYFQARRWRALIPAAAAAGAPLDLDAELAWLQRRTDAAFAGEPLVFCHNDVQHLNVLDSAGDAEVDAEVSLIDYEYAGAGYAAHDVANCFSEFCGIDERRTAEHYPDAARQREFVEAYVGVAGGGGARVDALLAQVRVAAMWSDLGWAIWGLLQSTRPSEIDFNYRVYAQTRMNEFLEKKKRN